MTGALSTEINEGVMKHKNWKAICKIPDTHFMWALALLDLATDFGRSMAGRLPEYFTGEQQKGPVPLSVLRMFVQEKEARDKKGYAPLPDGVIGYFDLPGLRFFHDDWSLMSWGDEGETLCPKELSGVVTFGKVVKWQGKKLVLVELCDHESWFVPAECIALDK